jgi:hypothetical protein
MAMAVEITWDLSTVMSCIDLSVRIVTKPPKVEPLLKFSISLAEGFSFLLVQVCSSNVFLPPPPPPPCCAQLGTSHIVVIMK